MLHESFEPSSPETCPLRSRSWPWLRPCWGTSSHCSSVGSLWRPFRGRRTLLSNSVLDLSLSASSRVRPHPPLPLPLWSPSPSSHASSCVSSYDCYCWRWRCSRPHLIKVIAASCWGCWLLLSCALGDGSFPLGGGPRCLNAWWFACAATVTKSVLVEVKVVIRIHDIRHLVLLAIVPGEGCLP